MDFSKYGVVRTDYNNKGDSTMTNIFNGMFGKVNPEMCRISMNGKIAIKTSDGSYKAYDVKTGRLTNCDRFVFDMGQDMFFVIPTNKVETGDIILVSGKPRCVIGIANNEIKAFNYENGTIETIVPERHIFMGKQYLYGKVISLMGNMFSKSNGTKNIFKYMMLSEMMKGGGNNNMLPMMMMMGGGNMFGDMFDFGDDDEDEVEVEIEESEK